jgi:glycosyltransferase involved in cell wall biosynthesis
MEAKHSIEKQTAHHVDCFTTVSEITNNECKELLDKPADVVLMNGFEDDFVPQGRTFAAKRKKARAAMLNLANKLLGLTMSDDTLIVGTSGRYEFKNKGINVYLESLNRLTRDKNLKKEVLAFINVPGWVGDPREDLVERLKSKENFTTPLECPFITHWLHNMSHDQVLDMMKYLGMSNSAESKVKVIFVPCYLDGKDGILNLEYYDLVLGNDLSVYPSYYEPWGYTPLESVAFHVPTITTDLAGFGLWVNSLKNQHGINDGVEVLHRSDYNYSEVADGIKDTITLFADKTEKEVKEIRKRAAEVAEQALWKHFIQYYYEAYDIALRNAMKRQLS